MRLLLFLLTFVYVPGVVLVAVLVPALVQTPKMILLGL
jgi:hypothetical protein